MQCFSKFIELFANAEAGKHPIKHRFSELLAGDLTQGPDRLAQVDRPEIPGQLLGSHLLTAWSRTQSCIALSSGEAELNAILKAACEGLSLQYLLREIGVEAMLHLRGDSSASHGTLQRLGSGHIKHLQTRQLWLQEKVYLKELTVEKIQRDYNWADILTHGWVAANEHKHFGSMGIAATQ